MNRILDFRDNRDNALTKVKQALVNKHRVIVAIMTDPGWINPGIYGYYHTPVGWEILNTIIKNSPQGSWVLTPEIEQDVKKENVHTGHVLIITGYDDNGVITGPNNTHHRGGLTLRNSWGAYTGDRGDYYMSYDYFKALAFSAIEISLTDSNPNTVNESVSH